MDVETLNAFKELARCVGADEITFCHGHETRVCPDCGRELSFDWIVPDNDPDAESELFYVCYFCGYWEPA